MLVRLSLKFADNQIISISAGLMSLQLSAETFDSLPEPTKKAIETRIGFDTRLLLPALCLNSVTSMLVTDVGDQMC